MNEHLPRPADLLRERAPGPARVDADANGVVHRLMDLADRGNYLDAAGRAAELLRGEAGDMRLIAVYLVGWFVERGAPALPELLACVDDLLGEDPASSADARRIDSAVEWLFRAVGDRVAFHATRRDEVWERWLQEVTPADLAAIAARSEAIVQKSTRGAEALQKIARWARNKLAPAVERAKKAATPPTEPAPVPEPGPPSPPGWDEPDLEEESHEYDASEPDDDSQDSPPPADRPPQHATPGPRRDRPDAGFADAGTTVVSDSPALAALREKLRGFEVLLARGRLDRAAVVARDIQTMLTEFDPVVYLPSLLGNYARLLSESFAEIEPHWHGSDSARWQVLVQFYRTDLAGFIDE